MFRIQNNNGIEPGSVIQLAQGATQEDHIVNAIVNDFVTLAGTGLTNAFQLTQAAADVVVTTFAFNIIITKPGPARDLRDI